MTLAILFTPPSMTTEQYDEVIRRLETTGAGAPAGRRYHVCSGTGASLPVLDVWDSQEAFSAFGQTLVPILQEVGVDPGQPEIAEVHNSIAG
jgi:hypothetical protein